MAYRITLSIAMQQELRDRLKTERQVKIHRRLKCVEHKSKGMAHQDIAAAAGVCVETVSHWIRLFHERGFEGLCSLRYEGRRLSRLEPVKEDIRRHVGSGKAETVLALAAWIKKTHSIAIQESGLFKFLKKNSIALTKRAA